MRTSRSNETLTRANEAGRTAQPPRAQFDTSAGATSSQTPTGEGDRHAALIGLYGELLNKPTAANGRFDGAGNRAQITAVTEGACFQPEVDRSGKWLAFASTQHRRTADIYLKSTTGRTQTRITSDPADDMMPSFAPDGKRLAFASNRYGNWDIFVTTTDAAPPMPITDDTDDELHPTWSPDGRQIAYCKLGAQSGRWEIWVVDLENLAAPRFLEYGLFPEWNPDPARSKIVFQRARERGSRFFSVWTIDYIGGEAMYPTEIISAANAAAMHPSWSYDGTRIVFVTVIEPNGTSERPPHADLWVISDDGTGRTSLTSGQFLNMNPVWSRDGTVYYLSDRSGSDNIWAVATGRTIRLGGNDHELVNVDPETEADGGRP